MEKKNKTYENKRKKCLEILESWARDKNKISIVAEDEELKNDQGGTNE